MSDSRELWHLYLGNDDKRCSDAYYKHIISFSSSSIEHSKDSEARGFKEPNRQYIGIS